jgi:3-phytase
MHVNLHCLAIAALLPTLALAEPVEIPSAVDTAPFASYDEAPATVDADDPAIWIHPERPTASLVIGTLKDAGLVVYDLRGGVVQLIAPPSSSRAARGVDWD